MTPGSRTPLAGRSACSVLRRSSSNIRPRRPLRRLAETPPRPRFRRAGRACRRRRQHQTARLQRPSLSSRGTIGHEARLREAKLADGAWMHPGYPSARRTQQVRPTIPFANPAEVRDALGVTRQPEPCCAWAAAGHIDSAALNQRCGASESVHSTLSRIPQPTSGSGWQAESNFIVVFAQRLEHSA